MKHLSPKAKKYSLIITNIILFGMIIALGMKIVSVKNEKVKGIYHINKQFIQFENTDHKLNFFYEPKPDTIQTWNPQWLNYTAKNTINNDSLNERYDYPVEKQNGFYRIITLGDSYTYGHYVDTAKNFSELLEDLLNNKLKCTNIKHFEVINLGVYGYDLEYSVERFIKRGVKYNPDLVIWFLNEWNIEKINELLLPEIKKLEDQGIPDIISKNGIVEYFRTQQAIQKIYKNISENYAYSYQKNVFDKFSNFYSDKLILVSLRPISGNYGDLLDEFLKKSKNYKYYSNIMENYWDDSKMRLSDGHPNESAHKIIAEKLFLYMSANYINSCKIVEN